MTKQSLIGSLISIFGMLIFTSKGAGSMAIGMTLFLVGLLVIQLDKKL